MTIKKANINNPRRSVLSAEPPNPRVQRTSARGFAAALAADAHSLGAGMKAAAIFLAGVAFLLSAACTDCRDRVMQHTAGGGLNADVHERVCGSAAGFTVRVYPPGTSEQEGDALDFEPFQSKCPPAEVGKMAVSANWLDSKHLEVRYSPALAVVRAEKQWKGVEISYVASEPSPAGT